MSESEAEAEGYTNNNATFPHFVIGLVIPLLLPTPTIWFSQGHKRNESGIGTLFSLDHKLYASDYDSVAIVTLLILRNGANRPTMTL